MLHDSHSHYLKLCERTLSLAVSLREEGEVAWLESPNGLGAIFFSPYVQSCRNTSLLPREPWRVRFVRANSKVCDRWSLAFSKK